MLLLVCGATSAQPQVSSAFAAGSAAFERGDYADALRSFREARAAGADSAALAYNLAVCLYRTGDFAQAEAEFESLAARYPAFRALAEYNRGLSLLALRRRDEAIVALNAARTEGDAQLAALAQSALDEIGAVEPAAPSPVWLGYFGFALGHDDNVALVDELNLPANVSADSPLTELLGYASRGFATHVPLRVDLSGYAVRYADDHAFDQNSVRIDALFQWTAPDRRWRFDAGPYFATSTLDGDGFERTLGAQLRAVRSFSDRLAFDVRFLYDDIESPTTRFDFVSGHRERLRLALERTVPERKFRAAYEVESQARADPGVSPRRNRLLLTLSQPLSGDWFLDAGLSHRTSRYDNLAVARHETLVELTVSGRRELRNHWSFNADVRWADNDSNVPQFSYTSRRISAGLSRTF